ncbi:hypothetical protein ACF1AJ_09065 [Leifsonia sp. NPDC014704]|uniref:hypothetical protein n=1 Tax=Leifsonia sp. NPDC014704 TaxID=3364123 RepID=UPI0036F46071
MSDAVIIGAGFAFLVLLGLGLGVYLLVLKRLILAQRLAIGGRYPGAVVVSAQAGMETDRALRRVARARGVEYGRTGKVYSVSASPGHLRLHVARSAREIVDISAAELVDFRIGRTSVAFANYTTVIFGVRAANTTFELPLRVMGPRPSSMMTANKEWAAARGTEMMRAISGQR